MKNAITVAIVAAAVSVVLASGAGAGAATPDGRSPDARDAAALARVVHQTGQRQSEADLRSPDARDAGSGADVGQATLDRRSPDAKDATQIAHRPVVIVGDPTGFDWSDAGIGMVGGFALALMIAGTAVLLQRSGQRPVSHS